MMDLTPEVGLPNEDMAAGAAPNADAATSGAANVSASGAAEAAAKRMKRAVIRPESSRYEIPKVTDDASYAAVRAGTRYIDPSGDTVTKPWEVKSESDYRLVPEGQFYIAPDGDYVQKPTFEPLNFTEQALYDMAPSASKRKVLEKYYPGRVKEDLEGVYVEDKDGKLRRPGATRGAGAFAGAVSAEVLPVGSAGVGGIMGGLAGNLPGALGGAAAGGALGQGINDSILALAGIYPESVGQEALRLGGAAAMSAAGEGAGRALGAIAPTMREGMSKATEAAPRLLNKVLAGTATTLEDLELGEKLTSRGYPAPPSMVLKGAPRLQNAVERFRERYNLGAMRSELEPYYEEEADTILNKLGIEKKPGEKLLHPTEAVSTEQAGTALQDRAIRELAQADSALDADIAAKRTAAMEKAETAAAKKSDIVKTAEEARVAAQKVVDERFADIRKDVENGFKLAEAGHKGGDLFQLVADKFRALRTGFGERANYWYDRFDQMTGGAKVGSEHLSATAQRMLDELPAPFKANNPALVQQLAKLAPVYDKETGELVKGAEQLSYGELQKLRTLFRGAADWETLSGNFKNGQLKFFSDEINRLLHDPSAPEQVKQASKFLDMVDKWYGHNIKIYESEMIKAVRSGIRAGEPADPKVLRDILLKEGHSDLIKRTFDMMGPTLANAVRAADLDVMLQASRTHIPGQIDAGRFYNEVLGRYRSGLLEDVHGKERTAQLLKQAEYLKMLEGKLPVRVEPGDRIADVIAKSRAAKAAADDLAKTDPLKTLSQEMKAIDADRKKRIAERVNSEQLGFLYDPTYGAIKSLDTILSKPDLILAAAGKFGKDSPEFNMMKQIYTKRLLQSGDLAGAMEKIPDSVQRLMFDLSYDDMKLLAKEWQKITDTGAFKGDIASGMMTQSKVEHPLGKIAGVDVAKIPGTKMGANAVWSAYYELVTDWTAKNHWLMATLLKGARGNPAEKAEVREILRKHAQKYGSMGAGAAEADYQNR